MNKVVRLYDDEHNYVGTLEEIITEAVGRFIEKLETEIEEDRAESFKVGCDEECTMGSVVYSNGCKYCIRQKYCKSFEKIES